MKLSLTFLLAAVLAAIGYGAPTSDPTFVPPTAKELAQGYRDHVILARPRAAHRGTVDDDEVREHIDVHEKFPRFGDLRVITLGEGDDAAAAIARLRATGRYDFVEPDYIRHALATPNDPKFTDGSLWGLNNTGQAGGVIGIAGADIKAVPAWDIIHDAPNVIVAVVDSGINLTHQDIAANLWTNPNPTNSDLHGANYVGGNGRLVSGNPMDDDSHGTHVAGIIGAVGNNGLATTGVAWKVQLMAVKVLSSSGYGYSTDIIGGINYAINHGASIINASFGEDGSTGYSPAELTAITAARNTGVIFVAAAGNSSSNLDISRTYPASFALDNIVTVGASNRRDEVSTFSSYGGAVDLFAPGEEILSLYYGSSTGTLLASGTSMSAPYVSGAFALLKAQFPNDTYRQSINRLLRGVDRSDRFIGKAQSGGRLNLYKALTTTTNRPFNDDFADRPHFAGDNLTIRSNNTGATAEASDPAISGYAASTTLWWEWTAPAAGVVSVDTTGSTYDTLLAVYTGTTPSTLTPIASNDNDIGVTTSRLTFTAQSGVTYQIAVDGKNGANGLTMLNLGTTPDNDAFGAAVSLTGQSTAVTATNLHCSRELGEPAILGFAGGNSLWYQWTAPRAGRFQVSALSTDFDPILAVYTGNTLTSLTLVSASDNTGTDNTQTGSLCTIDATAGTTYRIAVDSKTASAVGQFTLTLVDSQWQATTGAVLTGPPAVAADGTVYIAADDKSLYAFGPDGAQKWALATGGLMDACSPAIASDGTVYAGSGDGYMYAVNADGTLKWKHLMNATTATSAAFSPAIGADGTIYARASDGYLRALGASDGSELWKASTGSSGASYYGNPVVGSDGTIYQSSDETDHMFYAFNANGTSRWTASLDSGVYGAPAIDSAGNLYIATLTGGVYSYTAAGTQRWHVTSGDNVSSSVALSTDEKTFYYAGYDAKVYARDTANGTVKWTFPLGKEVRASSPAIDANGVIYVGCYDNKVYAINADGTPNRTYDTGNWVRSSPAIAGKRMYVGSNDQKLYAFDLLAGPSAGTWAQYRANARRLGRAIREVPSLATQPIAQTVGLGYSFTLTVAASSAGSLSYQWLKDGAVINGATAASYTVGSATSASAGSYTVKVSSAQGSVTSSAANVTVTSTVPGRLMNVSVRTDAGNGDQTLTVGFVLKGSGTKPLVIRGVGPTLSTFGVTTALTAPQLVVINQDSKATVASNTIWGGSAEMATAFGSVGAFPLPSNSKDDALLASLPVNSGGYSVQITGANGTVGNALAEVYDRDATGVTPTARVINVSARAQVGTGGGILIAGFNVSNVSGNAAKLLLIRGVGPKLADFGVGGVLANPKLEIYDNNTNQLLASNDDWGNAAISRSTFDSVGAFPLNDGSKDAALLISLPPGTYTAQVSGVGSTTGVGLVEVYEVQ